MRRPSPGSTRAVIGGLTFLAAAVALAACSSRRAADPPAPSDQTIGSLLTPRDRARLAEVARARAVERPEDGYRIGPDDLLDVSIPDLYEAGGLAPKLGGASAAVPDVSAAPGFKDGLRVAATGDVNVPQLGLVRAAGLTTGELEQAIARRLIAEGILRRPEVRVAVAEYRSGVVAVLGSVARPGLYPLTRPRATVADMIWAAGGANEKAGRVVEFAPRLGPDAGSPPAVAAPTRHAAASATGALRITDVHVEGGGDGRRLTITLTRPPERLADFTLDGPPRLVIDLAAPAATGVAAARFPVADGLVATVRSAPRGPGELRAVVDLSRSIVRASVRSEGNVVVADIGDPVLAAALPPPASVSAVSADPTAASAPADPFLDDVVSVPTGDRVAAAGGGNGIRIDLGALLQDTGAGGMNPEVRPGDVISIAPAGNVQVAGWVAKPGSYLITRNLTLSGAIAAAGGHLFPADLGKATVKRVAGPGDERVYDVDLDAVARGTVSDMAITDGDYVYLPASGPKLVPWGFWTVLTTAFRLGANFPLI